MHEIKNRIKGALCPGARTGRHSTAIGTIKGLVCPWAALTALGMDWTEGDTMKTTVNNISNITFIERKHACWTELLKNGDGQTDGRTFSPHLPNDIQSAPSFLPFAGS